MKKHSNVVISMSLVSIVVLVAFFGIRNMGNNEENYRGNKIEVQKLIDLDLENDYPGNAREVLKLQNRFIKCYYNEELTEDDIKKLAKQNQKIFDKELLERNPYDAYVKRLESEIEGYKKSKVTIVSTEIEDFSDAEREVRGGYNFCNLLTSYFLKEDKEYKKTNQKYYLREDETGKWKILFWEISKKKFKE